MARITSEKRLRVYQRDGFKCIKCKSSENLTLDHIVPVFEGGTNVFENLQTMCFPCNKRKGSKFHIPFFKKLKRIWYIHDYVQVYKEEMCGMVSVGNGNANKRIEQEKTRTIQIFHVELKKRDDKIYDLEKAITLLVEYLDVGLVDPVAPRFKKR